MKWQHHWNRPNPLVVAPQWSNSPALVSQWLFSSKWVKWLLCYSGSKQHDGYQTAALVRVSKVLNKWTTWLVEVPHWVPWPFSGGDPQLNSVLSKQKWLIINLVLSLAIRMWHVLQIKVIVPQLCDIFLSDLGKEAAQQQRTSLGQCSGSGWSFWLSRTDDLWWCLCSAFNPANPEKLQAA